jgi:hypothetical protein
MYSCHTSRRTSAAFAGPLRLFIVGFLYLGLLVSVASATEMGASVYPAGVETVLPGITPGAGASFLAEFTNFYQANSLVDSQGHSELPGFHLGVSAFALKFVHNWGIHVLGGTLVSYVAMPFLYESLNLPFGKGSKTGFSNPDIQPVAVAYQHAAWHWWYGVDVFTPGFQYDKNALVNIGQHNFAYAPSGAFTYFPRHSTEISSKFQYIVNGKNGATQYRSGNELVWEHDVMQNISKSVAIGLNGFFYQQTTNDLQNGRMAGDGHRGRDMAFGPEIRCHAGHVGLVAKYQRDMLVQNRPVGNSFWLQVGVPLGRPHE